MPASAALIVKLEQIKEDRRGSCTRMAFVECSMFFHMEAEVGLEGAVQAAGGEKLLTSHQAFCSPELPGKRHNGTTVVWMFWGNQLSPAWI